MSADDGHRLLWLDFTDDGEQVNSVRHFSKGIDFLTSVKCTQTSVYLHGVHIVAINISKNLLERYVKLLS